jgi:hypothetical protein
MHLVYLTHEWLPLVREIRFTVFRNPDSILAENSRIRCNRTQRKKRAVVLETSVTEVIGCLSILLLWLYLADELSFTPFFKKVVLQTDRCEEILWPKILDNLCF